MNLAVECNRQRGIYFEVEETPKMARFSYKLLFIFRGFHNFIVDFSLCCTFISQRGTTVGLRREFLKPEILVVFFRLQKSHSENSDPNISFNLSPPPSVSRYFESTNNTVN